MNERRPYIKRTTWSSRRHSCRICSKDSVDHYGAGYCLDCYPDSKEAIIIQKYMGGNNFAEIGIELNLSRERVRQLFSKAMGIEIDRMGEDVTEQDKDDIRKTIEVTYKQNRAARKYKEVIENNYEQIVKKLSGDIILSEVGMLKAIGLPASVMHLIEEEYPEFLDIISKNKNRWSWKYDTCNMCGTTEAKHKRWGYCENCYTRSDEWKEMQYKYRVNHVEEVRERNRKYGAIYSKRPEVVERHKQNAYKKHFEGNREVAFKKHGAMCYDCGMTRADFKKHAGKDMSVYHIDGDKNNNNPSNLIPVCLSCLSVRAKTKNKRI
jgi:hypothetical protein